MISIGKGIEFFSYYIESDELFSIDKYVTGDQEDEVLSMAYFDPDGRHLRCRISAYDACGDDAPSHVTCWDEMVFSITEDLQSVHLLERSTPQQQTPDYLRKCKETLAIRTKKYSGIFSKGYLRIGDRRSKTVLIDEELDKRDRYDMVCLKDLDLIIVHLQRFGYINTYVIGNDGNNWLIVDVKLLVDFSYDNIALIYDKENNAAILETNESSIIIRR